MNKSLASAMLAMVLASSNAVAGTSTATLAVTRMDCAVCPITVRKALENVPGVGSATVDFKTQRVVVAFDPARTSPEALTRATADAGFPSSLQRLQ